MSFQDFMNKVRHWDNTIAKWMMRHVYFMFFQFILLVIFLFWFVNMFKVLELSLLSTQNSVLEKILATQSINITIIVLLLILNSFWLLYIFNGIQRIGNLLKDLTYLINRIQTKNK